MLSTARPDPLLARALAHCEREGLSMEAPLIAGAISYARMTGQGFDAALAEMTRRAGLKKTARAVITAAALAAPRPLPAAPVRQATATAAAAPAPAKPQPLNWTDPRDRALADKAAQLLVRTQGVTYSAALRMLGHP
jgi:pyruvate/2-oxoglutarate dehydrogenase complex dihydrolipoamide acyltransferase (E2) component